MDVTIAIVPLVLNIEALGQHEVEAALGARHCNVGEVALLLDLVCVARRHVRWITAINNIGHEYRYPFLFFGRVIPCQSQADD